MCRFIRRPGAPPRLVHGQSGRWQCAYREPDFGRPGPQHCRRSRVGWIRRRRELTRILRDFPLRARKRRDFEIWARAVDRWVANPYDPGAGRAFHAQMARDAAALRDVRRYVKSPPPALDGSPEALLAYLGGFFSGEGCFGLSRLRPSAVVKLRRDDRAILELFVSRFGLGKVRDIPAYGGTNPCATWVIGATDELGPAVRLFEAAQLRGRKRREFEVWREAAEERVFARLAGRRWDRARVEHVAGRLTALRQYREPPDPIGPAGADASTRDARRAYIGVLRAFADELPDGKLHLHRVRAGTRPSRGVADAQHPRARVRELGAGARGCRTRRCYRPVLVDDDQARPCAPPLWAPSAQRRDDHHEPGHTPR